MILSRLSRELQRRTIAQSNYQQITPLPTMNATEIYQWIQKEMNAARVRKLGCNPLSELAMFKYYQGRQEAYQNCLDALQEVAAVEVRK
ncbi:hypothetical protein ACQ4M3_05290 [Leptolyngbya sp. AN03gr2]|uniref:hypothetical protein n=1 Tax=unclassified Leptolyngbya TaxID=2650499 RepID=UPI003D310769